MTITLKTLKDATQQEIFDQVARHLLTQKKAAIGREFCYYRFNGLKCAIGCLISDEEYESRLESTQLPVLLSWYGASKHYNFLRSLREVHDANPPEKWKEMLAYVASRENLSPAILETL